MPDPPYFIPVGDGAMLHEVFQGRDAAFALGLVAHVAVFLPHVQPIMPWCQEHLRVWGIMTQGIIPSKASFAQAKAMMAEECSHLSLFPWPSERVAVSGTEEWEQSIRERGVGATAVSEGSGAFRVEITSSYISAYVCYTFLLLLLEIFRSQWKNYESESSIIKYQKPIWDKLYIKLYL